MVTSALFTDGINQSLTELEFPNEFSISLITQRQHSSVPSRHPAVLFVRYWKKYFTSVEFSLQ